MRKLLIVLLALGAIVGYGAGFARLFHHGFHHGPGHHAFHGREHFEQRVADVCVEAAERRLRHAVTPAPPSPPQ
jgi:hypothetical protein